MKAGYFYCSHLLHISLCNKLTLTIALRRVMRQTNEIPNWFSIVRCGVFYSVQEICELLNVREGTVLIWIRNNELKAINIGRTASKNKPRWRVSQKNLDAFLEARSRTVNGTSRSAKARRRKLSTASVEHF